VSAFGITPASTAIPLDEAGQGVGSFTVSNETNHPIRVSTSVTATGVPPPPKEWLVGPEHPERDLAVDGSDQFTVQVSGNTIFVSPEDAVPIRNVPVVRPRLPLSESEIDAAEVASLLRAAVARLDLHPPDRSVALAIEWEGSATYSRLDALSRGIIEAEEAQMAAGQPLVLVCDSDVGGLLGLHIREELGLTNGIVSIDGIELQDFDYIDVGSLIPASGAAPVVIGPDSPIRHCGAGPRHGGADPVHVPVHAARAGRG